jgi:hypothetical protein
MVSWQEARPGDRLRRPRQALWQLSFLLEVLETCTASFLAAHRPLADELPPSLQPCCPP